MTQTTEKPSHSQADIERAREKHEMFKITNLSDTKPDDHYKFFKMLRDFIYQIEDDVLREQLETALKRSRSDYDQSN